jgi:hypothetical protein
MSSIHVHSERWARETLGEDWAEVPEGVQYTNEQATRKFLSLDWERQLAAMTKLQKAFSDQATCFMQDHDGAVKFARSHSCPTDRYDEGWRDGLAALQQKMEDQFAKDAS